MLDDNLGSLVRSGEFCSTSDRNRPDRASIVVTQTFVYKRDGEIKVVGESSIRRQLCTLQIGVLAWGDAKVASMVLVMLALDPLWYR